MAPIPLDLLVLFLRGLHTSEQVFAMLVSRVNDLQNPHILPPSAAAPEPRFSRFGELMRALSDARVATWGQDQVTESAFSIVLHDYASTYTAEVRDLLGLLGLPVPAEASRDVVLPISLAVPGEKPAGIALTTRSVFDVMQILSATVEVPEEHVRSGPAVTYPPLLPDL